jgi:hypothetical protein
MLLGALHQRHEGGGRAVVLPLLLSPPGPKPKPKPHAFLRPQGSDPREELKLVLAELGHDVAWRVQQHHRAGNGVERPIPRCRRRGTQALELPRVSPRRLRWWRREGYLQPTITHAERTPIWDVGVSPPSDDDEVGALGVRFPRDSVDEQMAGESLGGAGREEGIGGPRPLVTDLPCRVAARGREVVKDTSSVLRSWSDNRLILTHEIVDLCAIRSLSSQPSLSRRLSSFLNARDMNLSQRGPGFWARGRERRAVT